LRIFVFVPSCLERGNASLTRIRPRHKKGMPLQSATLFHDALRGLRFLHAYGWVHGNVKPNNIGVLTHPLRAVLLDLGQMAPLAAGTKRAATPGCGGTVNYLSLEREMDECDHGIDIWPWGLSDTS